MGINIRTKGQEGEREVARAMNSIVEAVMKRYSYPAPTKPIIQRNQNQSAVGGSDLSNPFGLGIEVKRQEALSINSWWNQCLAACKVDGCLPIVVFRQNGKKTWRVIMNTDIKIDSVCHMQGVRAEIGWEDFLQWFYNYIERKLALGLWVPTE